MCMLFTHRLNTLNMHRLFTYNFFNNSLYLGTAKTMKSFFYFFILLLNMLSIAENALRKQFYELHILLSHKISLLKLCL